MKNAFKLFGIAVLVTVIGFSAASCKNEDDGPISVTVTGIPADTNEREARLSLSIGNTGIGSSGFVVIPKGGGNVTFDITNFNVTPGPGSYSVELYVIPKGTEPGTGDGKTIQSGPMSISGGNNTIPISAFIYGDV